MEPPTKKPRITRELVLDMVDEARPHTVYKALSVLFEKGHWAALLDVADRAKVRSDLSARLLTNYSIVAAYKLDRHDLVLHLSENHRPESKDGYGVGIYHFMACANIKVGRLFEALRLAHLGMSISDYFYGWDSVDCQPMRFNYALVLCKLGMLELGLKIIDELINVADCGVKEKAIKLRQAIVYN